MLNLPGLSSDSAGFILVSCCCHFPLHCSCWLNSKWTLCVCVWVGKWVLVGVIKFLRQCEAITGLINNSSGCLELYPNSDFLSFLNTGLFRDHYLSLGLHGGRVVPTLALQADQMFAGSISVLPWKTLFMVSWVLIHCNRLPRMPSAFDHEL